MPICSARAFASWEHRVEGVGAGLGILAISKLFLRGIARGKGEEVALAAWGTAVCVAISADCEAALVDCAIVLVDCDTMLVDCACAAMVKERQHSVADAVLMPLSIIKRELVFP